MVPEFLSCSLGFRFTIFPVSVRPVSWFAFLRAVLVCAKLLCRHAPRRASYCFRSGLRRAISKYSMLRNSASGPEIGCLGRILAGPLPGKHRHRPSGRPAAGQSGDFGVFLAAVHLKSSPEGRSMARKHHCVTESRTQWISVGPARFH